MEILHLDSYLIVSKICINKTLDELCVCAEYLINSYIVYPIALKEKLFFRQGTMCLECICSIVTSTWTNIEMRIM